MATGSAVEAVCQNEVGFWMVAVDVVSSMPGISFELSLIKDRII
jgi:hypothetical protein